MNESIFRNLINLLSIPLKGLTSRPYGLRVRAEAPSAEAPERQRPST